MEEEEVGRMEGLEEGGAGGGEGDKDVEERRLEMLKRVLENSVVGERLVRYLPLSDMKMAAEVNKGFCRMMRSTIKWGDKAFLLVSKDTVGLPNFLVDTECEWKSVEIDVTIPDMVVDILTDILRTVQTMHLSFQRTDKMENDVLVRFMTNLITNAPQLRRLQVESIFMEHVLHDVFSEPVVQQALCKLQEFEVCTGNRRNDGTCYLDSDEDEGPFPRNFQQLACIPMKLETLKLGKITTMSGANAAPLKFVPDLIKMNADTLVDLTLHMKEAWRLETMKGIYCPKLKRLALTATNCCATTVSDFLNNQPPLENLSINMKEKFSTAILKTIQRKSQKLKCLHITAKIFWDPAIPKRVPIINWNFVSQIVGLKEFSIVRPHAEPEQTGEENEGGPNHEEEEDWEREAHFTIATRHEAEGTGVSFLKALPRSIKHLTLRGLQNVWYDSAVKMIIRESEERIALLSRFHNLCSLSIIRCDERALDDVFVQHILRYCAGLRKLELTHGHNVTNFGITGKDPTTGEVTGIPLGNLTALTHLVIKGCPMIENDSIVEVLVLPNLRHFEYLGVYAMKLSQMVQIVKQNPSLESITVHVEELDRNHDRSEDDLKEDLRKVNPRISKVMNLLDADTWVECDSDSDADQPIEGFWGGSDISGGGWYDHDDFFDEYDDYADEEDDDYEPYDGFDNFDDDY